MEEDTLMIKGNPLVALPSPSRKHVIIKHTEDHFRPSDVQLQAMHGNIYGDCMDVHNERAQIEEDGRD